MPIKQVLAGSTNNFSAKGEKQMIRHRIRSTIPLMGGLGLFALIGCGDMNQLKGVLGKGDSGKDSQTDALNLTDEAAQSEQDEATASANDVEIVPPFALTAEETAALPTYLQIVKEARDYTRKLLGLSADPVKEFHAAIQAARAISTSPEDFKENIASAREKFKAAMEAQKEQAAAAKAQHADELAKILSATQKVFLDCGDDFDRVRDPGKHRHKGEKHGKRDGHQRGKHGRGHGPDPFHKMMKLADNATGTSTGTNPSTTSQADSQACQDASAALKALITP